MEMKRLVAICSVLLLFVSSAAAEIKSIDLAIFGMD
jgi:hypothetical protein